MSRFDQKLPLNWSARREVSTDDYIPAFEIFDNFFSTGLSATIFLFLIFFMALLQTPCYCAFLSLACWEDEDTIYVNPYNWAGASA